MCRISVMTLCCLSCMVSSTRANDQSPVSDMLVQEAVVRSLPFLEREGVAWMNDCGCMSCQHVPFLLWTHRTAQAHGLAVDAGKLAQSDEWTQKDSLSHRNLFRLQSYDLGKVDVAALPEAVQEKLKPLIEQPFKTEAEFLVKLSPLLTADDSLSYQAIVLKTAERTQNSPDRTGGGLDAMGQLLLGSSSDSSKC